MEFFCFNFLFEYSSHTTGRQFQVYIIVIRPMLTLCCAHHRNFYALMSILFIIPKFYFFLSKEPLVTHQDSRVLLEIPQIRLSGTAGSHSLIALVSAWRSSQRWLHGLVLLSAAERLLSQGSAHWQRPHSRANLDLLGPFFLRCTVLGALLTLTHSVFTATPRESTSDKSTLQGQRRKCLSPQPNFRALILPTSYCFCRYEQGCQ